MIDISFYLRRFSSLILLIFFGFINSGCSDFRQAIGKEKFIPNEYSFLNTPQLIMPPGFGSKDNIVENKSTNDLKPKLDFKNKVNVSNLNSLFNFSIVPQDIRKIVDEETLGIRRSERTGIDVLLGNSPSVGVYLDSEKEAIRIKNNKEKSLLTNPSPSINMLDNKTRLIK